MTLKTLKRATSLAALLAGQAVQAQDMDAMMPEQLLPLAREEGQVVVSSFTSRIARVEEAFEAACPGINLVGYDISSTGQIARLKAGADTGTVNADVVRIPDAPVVVPELVETGILTNYVPPRVADLLPGEAKAPLPARRLSTKVMMYNEEAHPDGPPIPNLAAHHAPSCPLPPPCSRAASRRDRSRGSG